MNDLLDALRDFDALRDGELGGDTISQCVLSAIPPTYSDEPIFGRLNPRLTKALQDVGISRLYQHQTDAISQAMLGKNVVLQAPTASGKTLAFQIPMLESLLQPNSHALMIYPTKALALDQRDQLVRLTSAIKAPNIDSWWYDGDTDKEHREPIRRNPPKILVTNPDMLHNSFLGHCEKWENFYRGLKWIIIDEMHEYRGYFGSNVAMILRRFSHHLASLNIHPQFFLCSATCANAQEHAQNLTGLSFTEINASNGIRPQRHFFFVQPDIPNYQYWEILQLRTVKAGLACLSKGKSVLAFCPTRKFAESCHPIAMRELEKFEDDGNKLIDPSAIRVFRSGLDVQERHEIQEALKEGTVRLVFTTNALEMGIDIGGLDGIIMAGFPDSLMSAWQRIGRAGRSWDSEAFVFYFARNNPLDRFYAANLDTCIDKPLDDLVVNPENEELVAKHLPSLLHETPGNLGNRELLGTSMHEAVKEKIRKGVRPVVSGRYRPHFGLNIRGGGGMFILKESNREIGSLSAQQQFREAYQRAIYMHGGRSYRVTEFSANAGGGEISLESVEPWRRTNASTYTVVTEQDIYEGWRWEDDNCDINAFYGRVLITETINSVQELDERTGQVLDQWTPQYNSAQFKNAHAFWVQEQKRTETGVEAVAAFQQLIRIGALFSVPLDAHDISSHGVGRDRKAYLVESYPGGIGIAKKIFERWQSVLSVGVRIAERCACIAGCPNCIVPPRATENVDKVGGIEFASAVLCATRGEAKHKFLHGIWEPL